MKESEVERLRRLRGGALRLRSVARALQNRPAGLSDPLFHRGACAAWRLVRGLSGHLRAHPFEDFQRDASIGTLLRNEFAARVACFGVTNRIQALAAFERQVNRLSRQLDDARALAWARDLSDGLGRSQVEMRSLLTATDQVLCGSSGRYAQPSRSATSIVARSGADWPFVAL